MSIIRCNSKRTIKRIDKKIKKSKRELAMAFNAVLKFLVFSEEGSDKE